MVGETMGKSGRVLCGILYLLLFYSLIVAYMTLSGNHTHSFAEHLLKMNVARLHWNALFCFAFWLAHLFRYTSCRLPKSFFNGGKDRCFYHSCHCWYALFSAHFASAA